MSSAPRLVRLPWLWAALSCATLGLAQVPSNRTLVRPPAAPRAPRDDLAAAVAAARGAVAHVLVEIAGDPPFPIERPGSAVVLTADGLVLTLAALVQEAQGASDKRIVLQFDQGVRRGATLVAADATTGLALLQAEPGPPLPAVPLATATEPGDPVAVLSFHDGEDHVAFAGIAVPAAGPVTTGTDQHAHELARDQILLTDAAIQRRSHGAALLDRSGALVGLCDARHVSPEVQEPTLQELKRPSFGFVLPARLLERAFAAQWPRFTHAAAPGASPLARIARAAAPAVVAVRAGSGPRPTLGATDPYATARRKGIGSGVVVDASGLILTNRHLVEDATAITVTFADGSELPAEVLARDPRTNSALLKVTPAAGQTLTALPAASAAGVPIGATVLAVGRPEVHTLALSAGVLSARRGSHLQTDAGIGNHTGGGALLDLDGAFIALCDAGAVDRIDLAFAQQGDDVKLDQSLNLVPTSDRLFEVYREQLGRPLPAAASRPAAQAGRVAQVVERTAGAVLNLYVERKTAAAGSEDNPFAPAVASTAVEGLGSGVIVDPCGLALTNWHVVDAATLPDGQMRPDHVVRAARRDGTVFGVRVLSISREDDLALLQLELAPGATVAAVELGDSSQVAVGDTAIAIGNPHGRASTVTAGIVTARNRSIRVKGRWAKLPSLLETDAAINAGNSGGPLFDQDARLIGINSAGGKVHEVTGFAIAVDHVRNKLGTVLLSPAKLRSPWSGLEVSDRGDELVVERVDQAGPAATAGIAAGDLLRTLDGQPVGFSVAFALALLRRDASAPLKLGTQRSGQRTERTLTPWSAAAYAVFRQTSLQVREVTDPAVVHPAAVALWRRITGDPTAEPTRLPERLLQVEQVHTTGLDLQTGDLLLGIEVAAQPGGADVRVLRCEGAADLARCIQDLASYDGSRLQLWLTRKGEVRRVELAARKLLP